MAVACGSKIVDRSRSQVFKYDRWCTALVAQVLSALKGRMGAGGPGRPGEDDARDHQAAGVAQCILDKNSEPLRRLSPALTRNPVARLSQAPTVR
jgi:hypothetical protein